jgi:hypothetical protein
MSTAGTPSHTISPAILTRVAEIAAEVGRLSALIGADPLPKLRRDHRIRTIHAPQDIGNQVFMPSQ